MQILRVLVVALFFPLAACRSDERADVAESHLSDLQQRVGTLEAHVAELRAAAWWCTADRCDRGPVEGAVQTMIAWCPRGEGPCAPTLAGCGVDCVGVR